MPFLFVYGTLLSTQRNCPEYISKRPYTLEGASLYKHHEEDFPTLNFKSEYTVQGEILELTDEVFDRISKMEASAGFFVIQRFEGSPNDHFYIFYKFVTHEKSIKQSYSRIGSSWQRWCDANSGWDD